MRINDALNLARDLMKQHNVRPDCGLDLSRGKRTLGYVIWKGTNKIPTVNLSVHFLAILSDEEIRDTILHELAHVISGPGHHHDWYWKSICRKIGCNPERTAKLDRVPDGRYKMQCVCGKTYTKYRSSRTMKSHTYVCGTCKRNDLVWVDSYTGKKMYTPSPLGMLIGVLDRA